MIQFDIDLEFAIFTKVYEDTLELVTQDLAKRKQNLKWVYERDNLTADQLKKANAEEAHISLMVDYIRASENVFKALMDSLSNRRENQIDWHAEWKKEAEDHVKFVELMISKYRKLKENEAKKAS